MLKRLFRHTTRPASLSNLRGNSTSPTVDLSSRLQADLKTALKTQDAFAATTIRSVLSEVYAAQKLARSVALKPSDVISIVRKAELRRLESVKQYENASRPDLAQKEQKEADLLATYLPARLPTEEIDKHLQRIISQIPRNRNARKAKSHCLKAFYNDVDENVVDGDLVRQRIDALWST